MRFSTTTLGCKANQYDTGTIENILRSRGHEQVKLGSGCDVCIVNTCAVTAESVRKSRQAVRRVKKLEPDALIAVCGCCSKLESGAAVIPGADIIGGTDGRESFADEVEKLYNSQFTIHSSQLTPNFSPPAPDSSLQCKPAPHVLNRTRALLKIQDGCDNYCAYCIVPFVRGKSRSVPIPEIADKAKTLEEQGYKEIVFTGIEISSYEPGLLEAIRTVSANAPGARLRLGSLNPDVLTQEFIGQLADIPNLCSHFHISLQSGCDDTLARMGRRYSAQTAFKAIAELRKNFDNCGITADLIVGFPGETDAEFEQTLAFIGKADFSAMHIFPYSQRPGTKAAAMPGQVPGEVKKHRAKTAAAASVKMSAQFKHAQTGKTLDVLFETRKGGSSFGYSGNYLTVGVAGRIGKNTIAGVKITGIKDDVLTGEIVWFAEFDKQTEK